MRTTLKRAGKSAASPPFEALTMAELRKLTTEELNEWFRYYRRGMTLAARVLEERKHEES